jgi:hypothetical protein
VTDIVMLGNPTGNVAPGDRVFCHLAMAEVQRVVVYTPGGHSTSPIRADLYAIRIVTNRGSRWVGGKKITRDGERVRWER